MSFYSDASLVFIPSGYKPSKAYSAKPTDGTGDLTFTRSNDTATRVGPDGLIEKVRTNLILQSEAFNTASWNTTRATITANQAVAPDGTTTADLFTDGTFTSNNCFSDQGVSTSGTYNMSGFVKAGTSPFIALILYDTQDNGVLFNTSTQAITTFGTVTNEKVESVGNGWYRISFARTVSAATSFAGISVRPTNSIGPYNGTNSLTALFWGIQVETGDIATDYIATTSAAVSVGPVANVPRLDYLGSSCPRLLLEPQRSNLVTFSESFNNAAWVGGNVTVTANSVTSPDGYTNADTFTEDAATAQHGRASGLINFVSGTTYTFSAFAKNAPSGRGFVQLYGYQLGSGAANVFANFDLNTGVVGTANGGTSTITNYGNGWYRCTFTFACGNTLNERINLVNVTSASATAGQSYAGDITKAIYWYGAQVEAGAYATSYIPTLGAAVTRGADYSYFAQSPTADFGTGDFSVFFDVENVQSANGVSDFVAIVGNRQGAEWWRFYGVTGALMYLEVSTTAGGYLANVIGTYEDFKNGRSKVAISRNATRLICYVNGVEVINDTNSAYLQNFDSTNTRIELNAWLNGANGITNAKFNQLLMFKGTALSASDLAALTA